MFPSLPITVPSKTFLSNSGGNALHAALGMCDRVDVYGVGLFSEGPRADKIYAHAYDRHVGRCAAPPAPGPEALRMTAPGYNLYKPTLHGMTWAPKWLQTRVESELVMHVLHAFDIIRWMQ